MPLPRSFRTFAEFDRDYLREGMRLGLTVEDLVEEPAFDADLDFDTDSDDDDDDY
ncbi:MAG: transcriptional regulator [Polyangiaceae bacterium]